MANDRYFFYYDPQRQGYDTVLWRTITGIPAISGTDLRLNAAAIQHYGDIFKADFVTKLTIPTAPTAGDNREFGLKQLGSGAAVTFQIVDDVFQAFVSNGNQTFSVAIPWDAAWTATPTEFKIRWFGFEATFFVNDVKWATTREEAVPNRPLSAYYKNANTDNMDIQFMEAKSVQNYI